MTLVQVRVPDPQTKPNGLPRTAVIGEWRPERAIADSLFALARQIDGHDPLFDDIADVAAGRLLMAGKELDIVAQRRALRAQSRGPQAATTVIDQGDN